MDFIYDGGFQLGIAADMVLGKSAMLSLKGNVKLLSSLPDLLPATILFERFESFL